MSDDVHISSRRRLFDDFFAIDEAYVAHSLPGGGLSARRRQLSFERGEAAAAVVLHPDRNAIVMVRQFRFPTCSTGSGWVVELVAGQIDDGESAAEAMRREVYEETGLRVVEHVPIRTFYPSPGGSSERIHLFYAETDIDHSDRTDGRIGGEEGIETVMLPLDEVVVAVRECRFDDAKTIIGLEWLATRLDDDGRFVPDDVST